jgi:acyl-coenzyme A thioesterase PaaI-like protein
VRRKCARCLKAKKTEKASPEDAETQDAELTARLLGALRDDPAVRAVAETLQRGRQKNTKTARGDGEGDEGEGGEEDEENARARRRGGTA